MTSLQLTYGGVLLAVFANQICLPIPSVVFLIAAGALVGPWRNEREHHCFLGCFGLPGSGWDMVLARPQVGFKGYAASLPVHCRPAKLLQECA